MHQARYAHCEGYTDICFTEKTSYLTTGEDGDVRIWQSFDDLDNESIRIGDKCSAIAYKNGKIYVADDLNELRKYDLESKESQGVLTSFTLPITCISVNKSDTHLVCGSADFEIHLIDLKSLKSSLFTGHDAPILHVCFDPLEKYFVSSSCDGTARFWSLQTLNTVKTLSNLHKKSNDFIDSESFCKIAWHKDGGLIAVPCMKEIHFYERESWLLKFKIDLGENSSDEFVASICCYSPDGRYILVVTNTQMIYVHSIINKSLVYKYSYTKKARICSLVWNPSNQGEIIFCDVNGNMCLVKPVIRDDMNETASQEVTEKPKATKPLTNNKKTKSNENEDLEMNELLDLIDSDEKSNDSRESDEKIKKPSSKSSKKNELKSPNKKRKRISEEDNDEEMCTNIEEEHELLEDEDSNEFESLEKLKEKTIKSVKKDILMLENADENANTADQEVVETRQEVNYLQPAFQSSSTPLTLHERYMVWNSVGLITQFTKEGDESIDIEFHNATYHHTIHIKNQFGYTMADVSKEAVVMASPGKAIDEDAEVNATIVSAQTNHSKLACILINSCDNNKEWTIDMPRKEFIKCLCVSKSLIACMTSRRFLRVYGLAGTQKEVICFNGAPVCMRAYDNTLFICYGTQQAPVLNYSIYYIDDEMNREAEHGVLPLSEDAKLEWLGFSDEGNPFYYDSNGYLFAKCASVSKTKAWMPYSDLRFELKHKSDNHWLVGVAERNQMIKTILCRACKYPQVLPRPTLSIVSVNLPLCELDSEKTKLEKDYWKNRISAVSMRNYDCSNENVDMDQEELDEKIDKFESSSREILMKLFMFSCKNNREQRAYEVASIMDTNALQLAIKYATKTRALVLAQNLNILAEKKAALEYEKQRRRLEEQEASSYSFRKPASSNDCMETQEITTQIRDTTTTQTQNDDDIIYESENQLERTATSTLKPTETQQTINSTLDESVRTPSTISASSRLNPFKAVKTPLNDSSVSVINKLEKESATKEKEWKPSPTTTTKSKLTKSKVTNTPTNTLSSFFGKNN